MNERRTRRLVLAFALIGVVVFARSEVCADDADLALLRELPEERIPRDMTDAKEIIFVCTRVLNDEQLSRSLRSAALCRRANAFLTSGKPELAIDDFRSAFKLDNSNSYAQYMSMACDIHDADYTLSEAEKAIKRDPNYGPFFLVKAAAQIKKNQNESALLTICTALSKTTPKNSEWRVQALFVRARLYYLDHKFPKALADLNEAISLNSFPMLDAEVAYALRSLIHSKNRDFKQAQADADIAIRFNAGSFFAQAPVWHVYFLTRKYQMAYSQARKLYAICDEADRPNEVDPILWTKKGRSLATLLPVCLTDNLGLLLHA